MKPVLQMSAALALCTAVATPARSEETRPAVDLTASVVVDSFANLSGGVRRGVRQMGLLDVGASVDGAAFGAKGVEAYAGVQLVQGRSLSGELVGDGQVVSNIDAPDALRLFEAWVSVPIGREGFLKAGLIDLNGEFDVQSVGGLFLNSSHGIGPDFSQTGENGPSIFPTTSTAVVGGWKGEGWSARLGLFDAVSGDPDRAGRTVVRFPGSTGLLVVAEADIQMTKDAQLQLGTWRYTSKFDSLKFAADGQSRRRRGNHGGYAMVEGQLGQLRGQPIDAWFRAGVAETEFNPVGLYLGGGVATGPEGSRWGLALAHARLGAPAFRAADPRATHAETAIELTYSRAIGERLVIQPDVQYVINPGWDRTLRNALVAGLRLQITLF